MPTSEAPPRAFAWTTTKDARTNKVAPSTSQPSPLSLLPPPPPSRRPETIDLEDTELWASIKLAVSPTTSPTGTAAAAARVVTDLSSPMPRSAPFTITTTATAAATTMTATENPATTTTRSVPTTGPSINAALQGWQQDHLAYRASHQEQGPHLLYQYPPVKKTSVLADNPRRRGVPRHPVYEPKPSPVSAGPRSSVASFSSASSSSSSSSSSMASGPLASACNNTSKAKPSQQSSCDADTATNGQQPKKTPKTKTRTKKNLLRNAISLTSSSSREYALPPTMASSLRSQRSPGDVYDDDGAPMDHRVFVAQDQWVPRQSRKACVVCERDFTVLRKRHACRMCGDVVCSRCSQFKTVSLPIGVSKARVCSLCWLAYRRQRLAQSTPSLSSSDNEDGAIEKTTVSGGDAASFGRPSLDSASDVDGARSHDGETTGDDMDDAEDDDEEGEFNGQNGENNRMTTPVALLSPGMLATVSRDSAAVGSSSAFFPMPTSSSSSSSSQVRALTTIVLLSPTKRAELLEATRTTERSPSFESRASTVSSSFSSWSSASSSSITSASSMVSQLRLQQQQQRLLELEQEQMRQQKEQQQNMAEELVAAVKARELEQEVAASRERIAQLESRIKEQADLKEELSLEQQTQLREARDMIATLQSQLRQQEQSARDAAATRDSLCISNLQKTCMSSPSLTAVAERSRSSSLTRSRSSSRTQRFNSSKAGGSNDGESEALRQKLRMLERQLQQAGINVAEVIPYAVARKRITEISQRMGEISICEEEKTLDTSALGALRREYYVLEQEMERFHTALLMSDEYIEEQAQRERDWEALHEEANATALGLVRSSMPVEIACMSEQELCALATPSGRALNRELARRFKRTNVLQLLRVAPEVIVRMHPSVIEAMRTTGLTLTERRALHHALRTPTAVWRKQERDEMSQKKAAWVGKLKDTLIAAIQRYETHAAEYHALEVAGCDAAVSSATSDLSEATQNKSSIALKCPLIGKMCPVRSDAAIAALYAVDCGFPRDGVYAAQDIVKSDPEGVGEKALQEAQEHARVALTNQRQRALKAHYGMSVREVTWALGAMEEMDAAMERIQALDASVGEWEVMSGTSRSEEEIAARGRVWERVLTETKEVVHLLARRAGICLTGKRDPSKDAKDSRSRLECSLATDMLAYILAMVDELVAVTTTATDSSALPPSLGGAGNIKGTLLSIQGLMCDVREKNTQLLDQQKDASSEDNVGPAEPKLLVPTAKYNRISWAQRDIPDKVVLKEQAETTSGNASSLPSKKAADSTARPVSKGMPQSSLLLDAIRAKRMAAEKKQTHPPQETKSKDSPRLQSQPSDLFAAIRARKAAATPAAHGA